MKLRLDAPQPLHKLSSHGRDPDSPHPARSSSGEHPRWQGVTLFSSGNSSKGPCFDGFLDVFGCSASLFVRPPALFVKLLKSSESGLPALSYTSMCKFHLRSPTTPVFPGVWARKKCSRGDQCTFAHYESQLRHKPNLAGGVWRVFFLAAAARQAQSFAGSLPLGKRAAMVPSAPIRMAKRWAPTARRRWSTSSKDI